MLLVVGLFIAAIGTYKYMQIRAAIAGRITAAAGAMTTVIAKQEDWPSSLNAIGSVAAVRRDRQRRPLGIVRGIDFESATAWPPARRWCASRPAPSARSSSRRRRSTTANNVERG